jgi:hypothetical protein
LAVVVGPTLLSKTAEYVFPVGRTVERALVAGLALGIAAYSGAYLFTNWDMALHISNSYPRLLQHFIPVASVTLVAAYGRMSVTSTDGIVAAVGS